MELALAHAHTVDNLLPLLVLRSCITKPNRRAFTVSGWESSPNSLGEEHPPLCQYVTTLGAQAVDLPQCDWVKWPFV